MGWLTQNNVKRAKEVKTKFAKWLEKFEAKEPSRDEYNLLSKFDKDKADIHMSSRKTKTPDGSLLQERHIIRDKGSESLKKQSIEGKVPTKTPEQDLTPQEPVTEKSSFTNINISASPGSRAQDIRRYNNIDNLDGEPGEVQYIAELVKSKPKKILKEQDVENPKRYLDRPAYIKGRELQKVIEDIVKRKKK